MSLPEDWGESSGALAQLREVHNHRKSERRFQIITVCIFALFSFAVVICQAIVATIVAKDIILTALPIFTFILGKQESKDG